MQSTTTIIENKRNEEITLKKTVITFITAVVAAIIVFSVLNVQHGWITGSGVRTPYEIPVNLVLAFITFVATGKFIRKGWAQVKVASMMVFMACFFTIFYLVLGCNPGYIIAMSSIILFIASKVKN